MIHYVSEVFLVLRDKTVFSMLFRWFLSWKSVLVCTNIQYHTYKQLPTTCRCRIRQLFVNSSVISCQSLDRLNSRTVLLNLKVRCISIVLKRQFLRVKNEISRHRQTNVFFHCEGWKFILSFCVCIVLFSQNHTIIWLWQRHLNLLKRGVKNKASIKSSLNLFKV